MKFFRPGLIFTFFVILFFSSLGVVRGVADSLDYYRQSFRNYRDSEREYELAREKYGKLGTLSSRDELVSASQSFLQDGCVTLSSYFSYLQAELEEQGSVEETVRSDAMNLIEQELDTLAIFRRRVNETEVLLELETISTELDTHYEESEHRADFVKAVILLGELDTTRADVEAVAGDIKATVEADKTYPGRDQILGNWYLKITNKLGEVEGHQLSLWNSLATFTDLEDIRDRERLVEDVLEDSAQSRDLLVEVIDHLLEIVRAKKY